MPVTTITLDVTVDLDTDMQLSVAKQHVKMSGRNLLSLMMMVQNARKPKVRMFLSDFKNGSVELDLDEDEKFEATTEEANA